LATISLTPPTTFSFLNTPILSAGQSITVEYRYSMSAPVAGFYTIVEVQGVNTATGQTVGFLATIAINPG
jgi:hypothetical protein